MYSRGILFSKQRKKNYQHCLFHHFERYFCYFSGFLNWALKNSEIWSVIFTSSFIYNRPYSFQSCSKLTLKTMYSSYASKYISLDKNVSPGVIYMIIICLSKKCCSGRFKRNGQILSIFFYANLNFSKKTQR